MTRRAGDEAGFTLVELLTAMLVSGVVLAAVLGLLETALPVQARTADRVEATQSARLAMAAVTQRLRSQTCFDTQEPVLDASTGESVRFYSGLIEPGRPALQMRRLRYDAAQKAIVEEVWDTPAALPASSTAAIPISGAARGARVLVSGIEPPPATAANPNRAIFAYFAQAAKNTGANTPVAVPLTRTSAESVVRIDVAFTALGSLKKTAQGTTLVNQVHLRLADTENGGSPC
jgi:prepilin-type N-terminal cleavage/methylation domain-containing protein